MRLAAAILGTLLGNASSNYPSASERLALTIIPGKRLCPSRSIVRIEMTNVSRDPIWLAVARATANREWDDFMYELCQPGGADTECEGGGSAGGSPHDPRPEDLVRGSNALVLHPKESARWSVKLGKLSLRAGTAELTISVDVKSSDKPEEQKELVEHHLEAKTRLRLQRSGRCWTVVGG